MTDNERSVSEEISDIIEADGFPPPIKREPYNTALPKILAYIKHLKGE